MVPRSRLALALALSALLIGVLFYFVFGSFGDMSGRETPGGVPQKQVESIRDAVEPPSGGLAPVASVAPKEAPAPAPTLPSRRVVTYRPLLAQGGWTLRGRIVALEEEDFAADEAESPDAQPMKGVRWRKAPTAPRWPSACYP